MQKPVQVPMQKPRIKNWTLLVAPTAARELAPRLLPTMAVSATLYNCWKRFPSISGNAKERINRSGFPFVISFMVSYLIS